MRRQPFVAAPIARGWRADGRKRERDTRSALGAVLGPDPAAVSLDQAARDRQPEPEAGARAGAVGAPEALEHPAESLRLEALAGVLDPHEDVVGLTLDMDGDRAVGRACGGARS